MGAGGMSPDAFEDVRCHLLRAARACADAASDPDRADAWQEWVSIIETGERV